MTTHPLTLKKPGHQRALGQISVVTKLRANGATGLDVLGQKGSYRAVFPKTAHNGLEAVLVNTAGGVTGGDRFDVSMLAARDTRASITTQAAERIYRAAATDAGVIRTKLVVENGAQLCWLPQETILFDGCRLRRSLDVEMSPDARLVMLEPLVFGRAASGEILRSCSVIDSVSIAVMGRPLYLDRVNLDGDVAALLQRPAVGAGAGAMANLVLVDKNAVQFLHQVRSLLPKTGGASLLAENTLALRLLCDDSYTLRKTLLPILKLLTHNSVPKNWRL